MKVYVDELPQTIGKAKIEDDVNLTEVIMWFETEEEIEVKPLSDHDKQVRKQVCDEIYKKCEPLFRLVNNYENRDVSERNELVDILDQIEKGE